MKLQSWQQRVRRERNTLENKIVKLASFNLSDQFRKLAVEDQKLLEEQLNVMLMYSIVLDERIKRFYV